MCSFIMESLKTTRDMVLEWWNKGLKRLQWVIGIMENTKVHITNSINNPNMTKSKMHKLTSNQHKTPISQMKITMNMMKGEVH